VDSLEGTIVAPERIWLRDGAQARLVVGSDPGWTPVVPAAAGLALTPEGPRWFAPVADETGVWLEGPVAGAGPAPTTVATLAVLELALRAEREVVRLSQDLGSRYEEVDLLYTISEILGQTVQLEESARIIIRAVSSVVGARRASIVVHDERAGVLRTVAAQGIPPGRAGVIALDDPNSVAARVFREQKSLIGDPVEGAIVSPGQAERGYQGSAFMSVPISYAAPGAPSRCIGVINLTDRIGGDRFGPGDRKLVSAIANQIGAALENARLVARDREQRRLEREMELAKHLQQSLLPSPTVLAGDAEVGVRCLSLESVGGDFYTFNRLGGGRVGLMVGDVSSHGFSAALLMASAVSAAGIHASAASAPDQVLGALAGSLADELATSESYLTAFYAMYEPTLGQLVFANAGHPHAFRIPASGPPVRLEATAPPLGLGPEQPIGSRVVEWKRGEDLLCVWTDGLTDATDRKGDRYGEDRVLDALVARRSEHPEAIVAAVLAAVDRFAPIASDDRTLLVMRF
jgi:sigma-B regulation protein RsbU (phosphoserine phosphatase)